MQSAEEVTLCLYKKKLHYPLSTTHYKMKCAKGSKLVSERKKKKE